MKKEQKKDVQEMIVWLEEKEEALKSSERSHEKDTPVLYKVFKGNWDELDEESKKRYQMFGKAALLSGVGSAAVANMRFGPMIFTSPVILGGISAVAAYNFLSKKIKSSDGKKYSEQLAKISEKFRVEKEKIQKNIQDNVKETERIFKEYAPIALEKLKDISKQVAIEIDDLANMDQNKRIMQYQKIALNQYQEQLQLRKTIEDIVIAYNKVTKENEELIKRLQQYEEYEMCCYKTNEILN